MNKDLEKIRAKLKHLTLEWQPTEYLDTELPDVNEVLGNREKGLCFGHMMEVFGWESEGKTALSLLIAALAQQQGAAIIWGDFENSFDVTWGRSRGMEITTDAKGQVIGPESFTLIQPYVGTFGKDAQPRLTNAQQLLEEIEAMFTLRQKKFKRIVVVIDSIAAMVTEMEAEAGISGADMRTNMDLPQLLSRLLRRWTGFGQSYNILFVLINQLRSKPDKYKPFQTTGGNAPRFYSHIRVHIRSAKGRVIKDGGKNVGIQGIIQNIKNKAGSAERSAIGFKLFFKGAMEFLDAKKLEKDEG